MTDKKQFLDPISTISKIILLHFSKPKTKIRITDNVVELIQVDESRFHYGIIPDSMMTAMSRTYYRDSRDDLCYLYPVFKRFIELYILEKRNDITINGNSNGNDTCYNSLIKLGEFTLIGMKELQDTYGYSNPLLVLQLFKIAIQSSINGTYHTDLFPEQLEELTKNNLLDDKKVQKIWDDTHIIEISKTFEQCFNAEKTNDSLLLESHIKKISIILNHHDIEFKKMLGTDTTS